MSVTAEQPVLLRDYEDVRVRSGRRSGLTMAIAVHHTVNGRALGGCRMRVYQTPDEAVRDAERLARAMTFKAAVSGLELGGAKGVIALEPGARLVNSRRLDALRDFAELVESFGGRYITAQDVGTCADDIAYMAKFTDHVAGRPLADGGCGDPSPYTAHGVEVAIRSSLKRGSVAGRHVVVVGLGHVGGELARRLREGGARLTVSDVDASKRVLAKRLWANWVRPMRRSSSRRTCSHRARWAASSTGARWPHSAFRWWPAPPTTSWRARRSPISSPSGGSCGRPTS